MKTEPYGKGTIGKRFVSLCLSLLLLAPAFASGSASAAGAYTEGAKPRSDAQRSNAAAYQNRALSFELNKGQFDSQVDYYARGRSYDVFINSSEVALNLFQSHQNDQKILPLK